ncbi:MAG: hypothetical protein DMG18_00075 [Acidobacteria bacterium]|nr:MAG: hypothetical protein DMG18_00075 [Acidobacteriota bacterium]
MVRFKPTKNGTISCLRALWSFPRAFWAARTVMVAKIKPPVAIDGLTPGTTYAIQVRAYGPLGHTEWSDSATRMCI